MQVRNIAYLCITLISAVVILIYGQSLLVPLVLGFLLWFVMREIKVFLDRMPMIKRSVPSWVKTILVSALLLGTLGLISNLLTTNINNLAQSYNEYEPNLELVVAKINKALDIDLLETLKEHSGDFNFGNILGSVFSSITGIIGNAFMIVLYSLFILLEESNAQQKLKLLIPEKERYHNFMNILSKIEESITNYLGLKTFVSIITAVLSYAVLWYIGLDAPLFWAFLIFIFNFIPTIGSLIGTFFPAIFSLLQFGTFTPFLTILGLVGLIQIVVGNVLEPRLMGSSMNLSALVTIVALSFWGLVWGVTGMILSIPITVIMVIVLSQFEQTKSVAILLSEKGNVD